MTPIGTRSIGRKGNDLMESMKAAQVVFVDDEPGVCRAVHKTLERAGERAVLFVRPGLSGALGPHRCDLLITDLKMPGIDGMDLLRQVKQRLPWIPVLLVTGYGDVPLAVHAVKNGAVDFVEKPLDRDTFLQTVQRLIERNARPVRFDGIPDQDREKDPILDPR